MLNCQKSLFQLPKDTIYLNCAYMGPLLRSVAEVGKDGIAAKLNPSDILVQDFFRPTDQLRSEFANLINCKDPNRIVVIPSVSYGIANAVKNLPIPAGSKIMIVDQQFPSNAYPWFRAANSNRAKVEVIAAPDSKEDRGKKWNEKLLASIDENTSVVAIANCHWADGTFFDLKEIRRKTNEFNAALIIDGTQSVGAMPFDWEEIQPDALICAGYKWMLGPYSIGLACYGQFFDNGIPIEESWLNRENSEDFAGLVEYEGNYQNGALRYEVGEHSNFILVPMLLKSIKQVREWGPENIQNYCQEITKDAVQRLRETGFWIENDQSRRSHLFGIQIPENIDINDVKEELSINNIYVSIRGTNVIRVSPHLYNTEEDLHKLAECLLKLV